MAAREDRCVSPSCAAFFFFFFFFLRFVALFPP